MKLIAQVKLLPDPDQHDALKRTLEQVNAAANHISGYGWHNRVFRQYDLHHALYYAVREQFGLTAQIVVRVLAKVADAYKLDRQHARTFKPHGSIAYDSRILSWKVADRTLSIWTVNGRETIPFVAGEHHLALLATMQGEADLVYRRGTFYLYQTCEVNEPPTDDVESFLGIDLGMVNLAADSDGEIYSGDDVERQRRRYAHRRRNLQRKQTRAATRKLRQLAGIQARFQADTNHRISKQIVQKAQDTRRGIAVEDLTGIRDRVRLRRKQRARHANWAFHQLRSFLHYKARRAGVPLVAVDPRYTSQQCPRCGNIDKANRPNQCTFSCLSCGHSAPADTNAAVNIAARAAVNRPNELAQGSA